MVHIEKSVIYIVIGLFILLGVFALMSVLKENQLTKLDPQSRCFYEASNVLADGTTRVELFKQCATMIKKD
jgi:hypothetical protein